MTSAVEISRKPSHVSRNVDYVGFSNFPNQVFRRCIKNGFEFTIMVVGQSGLGKSTFLNTLFLAEVNDPKQKPVEPISSTVKIEAKTVKLVENDVRMRITFVDTPGFGDMVNNSNCWDPIVQFIDSKFSEYLTEETKIERPATIEDRRVHLCLYFIAPTGHALKALDIDFMRALQDRVNIIPVIAKADTLTTQEMALFKQNILRDLKRHDIRVYDFPEPEPTVPEATSVKKGQEEITVAEYHKRVPFAVVGSNSLKEVDRERRVRIREYPWGIVEVENLAHNDFVPLRDMIIRHHLIDLIDTTKTVHYENFRERQMCKMPKNAMLDNCDPFTQLEQERKQNDRECEDTRNAKEKIFKEKVALRELALNDRAQALDNEEKENQKILGEKRAKMEKLMEEVNELRRAAGLSVSSLTDSGSSISRVSPSEKPKKKTGTLQGMLFGSK